MFWLSSAVLVALAAAFVIVPLWRNFRAAAPAESTGDRKSANLAIFNERRGELDKELALGNLGKTEYDSLLLELQKNLLQDTSSPVNAARPVNNNWSRWIPAALLAVLLLLVYPMYGLWGYFRDVAPRDLYQQTFANVDGDPEIARDLVVKLGEVIRDDPENPWAMYFMARNLTALNMYSEALLAFDQAVRYLEDSPDKAAILGQYAQIMYITSGGELTPDVMAVVNQARAINPNEISVLQLLSIDAELKGDLRSAIAYWRLMIQADPNSRMATQLRANIATAQNSLESGDGAGMGAGPRIEVHVALAEGLDLPAERRVFVTVRDASREGIPPLAVTELTVGDLPATVSLDDTSAMAPMFNLSSAETVYVTAIVSQSGSANVQAGDYRNVSDNFAHNGQHAEIDLVISDMVQ